MTIMTIAPTAGAFANDPFYAMGAADARDEYTAGESIDTLKRRAAELLESDAAKSVSADLYRMGYANTVIGLLNGHIATVNAQCEVEQKRLARKQGRERSTRHTTHARR